MPFNQIMMIIMTCPKQNCVGFFCCLFGFFVLFCFLNLVVTCFLTCWSNTVAGCTRQQLLAITCRESGTLLLDCRVGMLETRYSLSKCMLWFSEINLFILALYRGAECYHTLETDLKINNCYIHRISHWRNVLLKQRKDLLYYHTSQNLSQCCRI